MWEVIFTNITSSFLNIYMKLTEKEIHKIESYLELWLKNIRISEKLGRPKTLTLFLWIILFFIKIEKNI